ncbi:MAG: DedA family protein [Pseudomonadota bacterium]|nr:DedA family protein [Pseudomonadota bacterium]
MLTALLYSLFAADANIAQLGAQYGAWLYALLFLVIFAETGLVVFPFLPGDSILFIAGTVAASAGLNIHLLAALLTVAAVAGDTVNYSLGHLIGPRVFDKPDSRFFKRAHLRRTQQFFEKYGGFTIIVGRFLPVIRTFAPFLAGVAGMRYPKFLAYNVAGGIGWIASLTYGGYVFGNIPWVKQHLGLMVVGIVIITGLPALRTFVRERRAARESRGGVER